MTRMPTTDERMAYLEGRVEEHGRGFAELRELVFQLDQKVDRRLDALDQKMSGQFLWILGVQITVLLAVLGALIGR